MHKEIANVKKITEDKVFLEVDKKAMCSCCRIQPACAGRRYRFETSNDRPEIKVGDSLEIAVGTAKTFLAIFIIFLSPLIVFTAVLVFLPLKNELGSFFLALSAMVIYYVIAKLFTKKIAQPDIKILGKIKNG